MIYDKYCSCEIMNEMHIYEYDNLKNLILKYKENIIKIKRILLIAQISSQMEINEICKVLRCGAKNVL